MKIKNIIILGGIALAVYYLTKKKSSTITANSTPDDADKDLTDVSNGDEPQSLSVGDMLKLFNQANLSYRGGARPSQKLLADISVKRQQAVLRLKELGLIEKFNDWKKTQDKKDGMYPIPMGRPLVRPDYLRLGVMRDKMPLPRDRGYRTYAVQSLGLVNEPPIEV